MNPLHEIEAQLTRKEPLPHFQVGDTVDVHVLIREGEKERVQVFTGTVIRVRGGRGLRGTFTVRRIVSGEGVERIFPFHSPRIQNVRVTRPGKVRRAKLYYLRERVGKATKVKERRVEVPKKKKKSSTQARKKARRAKAAEGKVEQPVG